MAKILCSNLHKVYPNGVEAVAQFNLEIADREFFVLVGPSGCGKSTLLRMIAGLEDITDGELEIDGKNVNNVKPKDRNISMAFQNYALYPHMTAYENIALGMKLRHVNKDAIRENVEQTAKLLDIYDLLDRKPGQMSGGQQQRVALGRAIARQPSVFLLDEPLSNLDAKQRNQMRLEIIELHKKLQTTFVYVTHDQTEAMTMADRVVVMNEGHIIQVDTPNNLYKNPKNIFVAGFIGTPQMNFLDGTLQKIGEEYFLQAESYDFSILPESADKKILDEYLGKSVTMGIRPENISVKKGKHCGKLELAEVIGSDTYLHIMCGERMLTAKISSDTNIEADEQINFDLNADKIYLCDKQTGERIK